MPTTTTSAFNLVNVQEKWSGREGGVEQGDGVNAEIAYSRRYFTVLFDDPAASEQDAYDALGVPELGDAHPSNSSERCYHKFARRIAPTLWEVLCEYSGEGSPLTFPYERHWEQSLTQEAVDVDYNGDAILNPVGDLYVGLMREHGDPVYVVTRNELLEPLANMRLYQNAVNDAPFKGWAAGNVRMLSIIPARIVDGASYYWKVTYRMEMREDGWKLRVLCQGKQYWTGQSPGGVKQIQKVTDYNGQALSRPMRLGATGLLLGPDDADVWQEFEIYAPQDFDALALT